jgi:hypothetical protein
MHKSIHNPDKPLVSTSQDQYWQDFHLCTPVGFGSQTLFEVQESQMQAIPLSQHA